jgi:hypothetical protein
MFMHPDRRNSGMELFLHSQSEEIDVVEADGDVLVAAFLEQCDENGEAELWLVDADTPLAHDRTLADAGVTHHSHVHLSRAKKVDTFVTFNGETKDREFGPNSTFQKVFDWATSKHEFDLTPEQKTKHTLEIAGTEIEPELTQPIERYATDDVLRLNLVPKDRHAG